jgi:hypothetical protein
LKENEPLKIENCGDEILNLYPPLAEIPPRVFVKLSNLKILIINFYPNGKNLFRLAQWFDEFAGIRFILGSDP